MSGTYRSTKDIAALVRESLKKELPGWKFNVTVDNYSGGSSINLSLMSGPEQVFAPKLDTTSKVNVTTYFPKEAQLNHYTFQRGQTHLPPNPPFWNNGAVLTEKGWEVMAKATEILGREHWDESDAQTDYFCCSFYMHVNIGKWNQPFVVKETK